MNKPVNIHRLLFDKCRNQIYDNLDKIHLPYETDLFTANNFNKLITVFQKYLYREVRGDIREKITKRNF